MTLRIAERAIARLLGAADVGDLAGVDDDPLARRMKGGTITRTPFSSSAGL